MVSDSLSSEWHSVARQVVSVILVTCACALRATGAGRPRYLDMQYLQRAININLRYNSIPFTQIMIITVLHII